MTTATIEVHLLVRMLYTALAAGIGVSLVFSVAVYGVVRSGDARNAGRPRAAVAYAALGTVGLGLAVALVAWGLVLLASKH